MITDSEEKGDKCMRHESKWGGKNKKKTKTCTASNKAFLCISSCVVTFFLIEQSYVAKTSCKWSAKHLRFFMVTYQFTPVDNTIKHFAFIEQEWVSSVLAA